MKRLTITTTLLLTSLGLLIACAPDQDSPLGKLTRNIADRLPIGDARVGMLAIPHQESIVVFTD